MPPEKPNQTIIIRRSEGEAEGGHHGGAWKVAYADFVTAMMAFFLLMWLLNATTEKQRQGLADYFNPTLIHAGSTGPDALQGMAGTAPTTQSSAAPHDTAFEAMVSQIESALEAASGESMQNRNLLRHVVTRVTDEGLVIELSDLTDEPLFAGDTAQPTAALREVTRIVVRVLTRTRNELAYAGHVRGFPSVTPDSPAWPLSEARAQAVRQLIEASGIDSRRSQRVTAWGDRRNRSQNAMDPTNNRVEVILLR